MHSLLPTRSECDVGGRRKRADNFAASITETKKEGQTRINPLAHELFWRNRGWCEGRNAPARRSTQSKHIQLLHVGAMDANKPSEEARKQKFQTTCHGIDQGFCPILTRVSVQPLQWLLRLVSLILYINPGVLCILLSSPCLSYQYN